MQTKELTRATPRYVLLHDTIPLGFSVVDPDSGTQTVIFGFSGKAAYDAFLSQNPLLLLPYPLVGGYLRQQTEAGAEDKGCSRAQFVVLDAASPREPSLNLVTVEAVLEAQQLKAKNLPITHHLHLNSGSDAYCFGANVAEMEDGIC